MMGAGFVPAPAAPSITQQPQATTIYQGQTLTLRVSIYAYPEATLQWQRNGANIPGATSSTYTVANAQPADAGYYLVVASNRSGRATSQTVSAIVIPTTLPAVVTPPASQTVQKGERARFEIVADGTPAPAFRWRRNGALLPSATGSVLMIPDAQPSDEGQYDAILTNLRGSIISPAASLRVTMPPPPPPAATRILAQPAHVAVATGQTATFRVSASGETLAFQWRKNGIDLPGATQATFTVPAAIPADMGFYSVIVRGASDPLESDIAILAITATGTSSRLVNCATRGFVPAGGSLTPGFVWRGPGPKEFLIRAVGPTLGRLGITGALPDPRLEIFPAGHSTATLVNDDWHTGDTTSAIITASAAAGAFTLPPGSKDAAAVLALAPGANRNHSVRITSPDPAAAGLVLAEIYDPDATAARGQLASVSALAFVGDDDRTLLPGFTIAGSAPKRLLIRAIGPGLAAFGVADLLENPRLALHTSVVTAPIARNDDWSNDASMTAALTTAGAFPLAAGSRDAALVVTLPPGAYTVSIAGAGGTAGHALVEIHDLDP
jgi:hypothetical protein